jgi:hypothetical protein
VGCAGVRPVRVVVVAPVAACRSRPRASRAWQRCAFQIVSEPCGASWHGTREIAARGGRVRWVRGLGTGCRVRVRKPPANTGCCSHGDQGIVSRKSFCAVAVQQNAFSLGRSRRSFCRGCCSPGRCAPCSMADLLPRGAHGKRSIRCAWAVFVVPGRPRSVWCAATAALVLLAS